MFFDGRLPSEAKGLAIATALDATGEEPSEVYQAEALTQAAAAVLDRGRRTPESDAVADRWLALAAALGPWLVPLEALASHAPEVAPAIADEYLRLRQLR